jgi:hypothetical protein
MELIQPVVQINFNEIEVIKQFTADEYLLIDSENKKINLFSNGEIQQGYTQLNLSKRTFMNAEPNKKTFIKIDSPTTGVRMDVLYRRWVID